MRSALASLLLMLAAATGIAADPVYLDEIAETPLSRLQTMFAGLKNEGCYRIAEERYVLITIDKKDEKPWRVVLSSTPPCRRADTGPAIDLRVRTGVELGETQLAVVGRMGRPDTAAEAEPSMKKFGDMEFFYLCRVSESCARHTSVFLKQGTVSAVAEWYSE